MKNSSIEKLTSYSVILIGSLNIITWSLLISSGKVTDFSNTPVSYAFHWISELSTASLLILSGILYMRNKAIFHNLLSLALGALLMAIGGAFAYYLVNFEWPLFIMTAGITGYTVVLIIINYRRLQDFILLTLGVCTYSLLNLLGGSMQDGDLSSLVLEVPAIIFLIVIIVGILGKNMSFKYLPISK